MRKSVIGILGVAALAASSFAIDTSVAREGHGGGRGSGGGHAAFSGGGGGMSVNRGGSGMSFRAQTASPRFSSGPSVGARGYAVSPRVSRGSYTAYSGNRYTGNYGSRYAGNYGNRYAGNYGNRYAGNYNNYRRGHRRGYGYGWPLAVGAIGAYGAYAAYDYDSCYQPQRVWTPYGWTWQQVYVCGDYGDYGGYSYW